MYKTVKTQTNLPVKICHLKVYSGTSIKQTPLRNRLLTFIAREVVFVEGFNCQPRACQFLLHINFGALLTAHTSFERAVETSYS